MLAARPLAKVAQHVWFDVDREDLTVRHAGGDSDGEITSTSADVGDFIGWSQMQRIQDFVRLLQGVALRIVELFGPFFGIAKGVMTSPSLADCLRCDRPRAAAALELSVARPRRPSDRSQGQR